MMEWARFMSEDAIQYPLYLDAFNRIVRNQLLKLIRTVHLRLSDLVE